MFKEAGASAQVWSSEEAQRFCCSGGLRSSLWPLDPHRCDFVDVAPQRLSVAGLGEADVCFWGSWHEGRDLEQWFWTLWKAVDWFLFLLVIDWIMRTTTSRMRYWIKWKSAGWSQVVRLDLAVLMPAQHFHPGGTYVTDSEGELSGSQKVDSVHLGVTFSVGEMFHHHPGG